MKEIESSRIRILLLLAVVYLMVSTGCGIKTIAIPDSRMGESHPTKPGYECFSTGYIQDILKEIDVCLDEK